MNNSHSSQLSVPSPTTGTRARLGHVVRWHAEPISTDTARESRDEAAEVRAANAVRPL